MRKIKIIIETGWYEKYEITEIKYCYDDEVTVYYKNCDNGKIDCYYFYGCLSLETIVFKLKEILDKEEE